MAYEGQVVKLEDGRWARFEYLDVQGAPQSHWNGAILVAVELPASYQSMLDVAAAALESSYEPGAEKQLTLARSEGGEMSLRVEDASSLH